jgi:hypothetical protein
MRFAYADPPYLGCGAMYAKLHPEAMIWDDPETHRALIGRLCDEYPDGWALSSGSKGLRTILPMCPADVRVGAWVKPFCAFMPQVKLAYAWEPVMFRGGRKRTRWEPTMRDWVSEPMAMKRGFPGAKPEAFCFWVFDVLNMDPDDLLDDLFPGSGAVGRAWQEWRRQPRLPLTEGRPKSARSKGESLGLFIDP